MLLTHPSTTHRICLLFFFLSNNLVSLPKKHCCMFVLLHIHCISQALIAGRSRAQKYFLAGHYRPLPVRLTSPMARVWMNNGAEWSGRVGGEEGGGGGRGRRKREEDGGTGGEIENLLENEISNQLLPWE